MSPAKHPGTPRDSAPDFDQTMPPGAFERALQAGEVTVAVLSADAGFIETLWDVGHAHPSIVVVDSWPALLEAVGAGGCPIVLLDVDHVGAELGARLAELQRLESPPVVVAAGEARRAPEMMRLHAERRIHRLLVKPASPGKLQLLLGAALTRSRQPREIEDQPDPAGPSYRPPREAADGGMRRRMITLSVGMAVVFAAVVAVGLGWKSQRPAPPAVAADVAPDATRAAAPGATESARAGSEPRVGRIERTAEPRPVIGPPLQAAGDPAPGWSLAPGAALDVAPGATPEPVPEAVPNREELFASVERALLEDDLVVAAATLDRLRLLDPGSTRLAFLDAQLERAHLLRAVTEPTDMRSPAPPAEPLADSVAEAAAEPVAEAAADPVVLADPVVVAEPVVGAGPVAPPARRRPAETVSDPVPVAIAAAHQALDSGALEAAEMLITESRWLGADETSLGELEMRLDNLRESLRRERQALLLALGRERTRDGRLIAPEADNAVHYLTSLRAENPAYPGLSEAAWELTPRLVDHVRSAIGAADWTAAEEGLRRLQRIGAPEGITGPLAVEIDVTRRQLEYLRTPADPTEMKLLRTRAPIYPQLAVRNELEGWVDFQFIVDRDGVPRELAIVGEQPAGVFSHAATEAVERYRYAPFVRDGVTYERLVRVRVEFTLD